MYLHHLLLLLARLLLAEVSFAHFPLEYSCINPRLPTSVWGMQGLHINMTGKTVKRTQSRQGKWFQNCEAGMYLW